MSPVYVCKGILILNIRTNRKFRFHSDTKSKEIQSVFHASDDITAQAQINVTIHIVLCNILFFLIIFLKEFIDQSNNNLESLMNEKSELEMVSVVIIVVFIYRLDI
jgi:hypothetical protein